MTTERGRWYALQRRGGETLIHRFSIRRHRDDFVAGGPMGTRKALSETHPAVLEALAAGAGEREGAFRLGMPYAGGER